MRLSSDNSGNGGVYLYTSNGNNMGSTPYQRKATFRVVAGKNKEASFEAVNKRAGYVCKQAGRRSKISKKQLKELVGRGSYTFWYYNKNNELKPIKF